MFKPKQTTMQASPTGLMHRDSRAWTLQVWLSFGIAVFLCAVGLAYLPGTEDSE